MQDKGKYIKLNCALYNFDHNLNTIFKKGILSWCFYNSTKKHENINIWKYVNEKKLKYVF